MFCNKCEFAPKNYNDYCKSKHYIDTDKICPDAFEERANYCEREKEVEKKKENKNG